MTSRPSMEDYAALERYDMRRIEHGAPPEPSVPDEPGVVHAIRTLTLRANEPQFLEGVGAGSQALCGASVRIIMPVRFQRDDPDACAACTKHYEAGTRRPPRRDSLSFYDDIVATAAVRRGVFEGSRKYYVHCSACGSAFTSATFDELEPATDAMTEHNDTEHHGLSTDRLRRPRAE